MTLTATKRFVNTSTVVFTPTGGSAIPLTGIVGVDDAQNPEILKVSGDADLFSTFAGVVGLDPVIKISTNKPALMDLVAPGAFGVLTWTANDARNGSITAGGAQIYTVANAIFMPMGSSAPHRKEKTGNFEFHTQSTDGVTNPVSVAAA